jgi:hypothetical protein
MTVYMACPSLANVSWPEPIEPAWHMLAVRQPVGCKNP